MGLAGQSNYASANAFLDALAWHRRSRNQEATAINWGVLGKVGWTARHEKVEARFNSMGALSFDPKTALKLLECFLERKPTQISVLNTDWAILMDKSPAAAASPLFSSIVNRARRGAQSDAAGAAAASLSRVLGALDDAEALKVIEAALRDQIAKVVGTAASELDIDMPLTDLGFDSLMAVELRNWVECDLGVNLRTMEIMRGPTIRQLAAVLLASFRTERQGPVLSASSVPLQ
jgi:acyl carrier protein